MSFFEMSILLYSLKNRKVWSGKQGSGISFSGYSTLFWTGYSEVQGIFQSIFPQENVFH